MAKKKNLTDRQKRIRRRRRKFSMSSWSASWCMSVPKGGRKKDWVDFYFNCIGNLE